MAMEKEIMQELSKLLEKTGLADFAPLGFFNSDDRDKNLETTLIHLKSLNARYEKGEALNQVQWLMNNYNIQIDELMERITS